MALEGGTAVGGGSTDPGVAFEDQVTIRERNDLQSFRARICLLYNK